MNEVLFTVITVKITVQWRTRFNKWLGLKVTFQLSLKDQV